MNELSPAELHSATARPETSNRVFGLDLLRAIAILLVVYGHSITFLLPFLPRWILLVPLPDGVDLFFVLSGFLIGSILVKTYDRTRFTPFRVLHFWGRRWLRTLPNYMLVLTIVIVVAHFSGRHGEPVHLAKYYLFLQNFSKPQPPFFPESWSLAVEEWFYLTTPVMLLFLDAVACRWCSKQVVCWLLVAINLAAVTAYRFTKAAWVPDTDPAVWDKVFRTIVVTRLDSIMFGVVGAILKYFHEEWWRRHARLFLGLGLATLLGVQSFAAYQRFGLNSCGFFMKGPYFSIVSFGTLCLLPMLDMMRKSQGLFAKAVTHISLTSYSLYLVNGTLLVVTFHAFFPVHTLEQGIENFVLFWISALGAATVLYAGFEKPVLELRDRLTPKRHKTDTIT
ncbi:MAG: acyltransferase family protein [Candidatus Sumerlaeaceae bacterium]